MKHIYKKINPTLVFVLLFLFFTQLSCKKYLDAIPDKSLTIPKNIKELQALLDHPEMNLGFPAAGELAADNIYLPLDDWNYFFFLDDRTTYTWGEFTDLTKDWQLAYKRIFKTNVVMDALKDFNDQIETEEYKNVKGSALFHRACALYELSQLFAPIYSSSLASSGYGIPLRTTSDITEKTVRSTIQQTYDKIMEDLNESLLLLPSSTSYLTRPSKRSAFALLSRIYLTMNDYVNAGKYADACLEISNALLNYNETTKLNVTADVPFKRFNDEVIFHAVSRNLGELIRSKVDTNLVKMYDENDIRKKAFFKMNADGSFHFKGNYDGTLTVTFFSGMTTAEMYLTSAECKARANKVDEALHDLNTLLAQRWVTGTFTPVTATSALDALTKILQERRKELCFRSSLRWSDLRRLNLDNNFAITLTRHLNGQTYTLPPNDKRYTFLIPDDVIDKSGIQQNPR